MAPNPQCAALAAAKEKTSMWIYLLLFCLDLNTSPWPELSYGEIAVKIGSNEQHVIDSEIPSEYP